MKSATSDGPYVLEPNDVSGSAPAGIGTGGAVAELAVEVVAPGAYQAVVVPSLEEREAVVAASLHALYALEILYLPGDIGIGADARGVVA